jgi:hypothetical protein
MIKIGYNNIDAVAVQTPADGPTDTVPATCHNSRIDACRHVALTY